MAYAALLSLSRTLDNILLSHDESLVLDEHIKSLHKKLDLLISFLEETSPKNSGSIEDLEERIRDVVYQAEDIIESHMSKQILSRSGQSAGVSCFSNRARCLVPTSKKYEEGLQNVMEKLDSIWGEVEKMKDNNNIDDLQIRNPLIRPDAHVEAESTSEITEVEKMQSRNLSLSKYASTNKSEPVMCFAFEDNILRIKELLVGSSIQLEAISIVGMGGIGKTTLARSIYHEPLVSCHFDIRAWITVSQKYNVVALLINLLKSMGIHTNEMNGEDTGDLKRKVYQSLKRRRYLIVMDDIWDTDFLKEFKNMLPDDNIRSRIIMTSRSSKVANFERYSSHIHHMEFLSPEQSWNFLRHKALGKEPCPPGVEEIGRKIAEKCKGLPLSLAVVGGLLYKEKKTQEHWKYIEENMKSTEVGNYDDLMEVLSLSYNHLPHHLRACFLYMAVYPEDYVIHVSHLIRLWLAEGFIRPIPPKSLEQAAKEYLEELIVRNLIMVRDKTYYGAIKTCTIHDLMRDLCMRKARQKMFLEVADNNGQKAIKFQRCLSIHQEKLYRYDTTLRSLLFFTHKYARSESYIASRLQLLRVFCAGNIRFNKFPIEIVELVNLRYLAFFYVGEDEVASSISKLCNLQTLIIVREKRRYKGAIIVYLPPEILKMPMLRHLLVDGSSFLSYPCGEPNGTLQVLSGVVDLRFTQEAIEKFIDLKTLAIVYCHNEENEWPFYCLENLVRLRQLEHLKFHFGDGDNQHRIPHGFAFPQKLNMLTLSNCAISWANLSAIGSLPNLQALKLKNVAFYCCALKTNEGEFSKLKYLLIQSFELKHWEVEESHFPVLECLSLRYCLNLECIPSGIGEIQSLQNIVLEGCSLGVVDSANEILKEQHEFGNESLQVHVNSSKNERFRPGIHVIHKVKIENLEESPAKAHELTHTC